MSARQPHRPTNRAAAAAGFTLVELLVVIGIIAILISILMPALTRARKSAQTVACASNMRQAGLAIKLYQQDYKGFIPRRLEEQPPGSGNWLVWQHQLSRYIPGPRPYEKIHCESVDREISDSSTLTFGLNAVIVGLGLPPFPNFDAYKRVDRIPNSSNVILIADSISRVPGPFHSYRGYYLVPEEGSPYIFYTDSGIVDYRHNKQANVLYLDMHVSLGKVPPNDSSGQKNQHPWMGVY